MRFIVLSMQIPGFMASNFSTSNFLLRITLTTEHYNIRYKTANKVLAIMMLKCTSLKDPAVINEMLDKFCCHSCWSLFASSWQSFVSEQ